MKTAIQMICDAYAYTGIAPAGLPVNGNMSKEGLGFLNEVIYRLNSEDYFPFTNVTIDGTLKHGQGIIAPRDDADFVGEKPLKVNKVLYRYGNQWISMLNVGYENIWERRLASANPEFYAFTNNEEGEGVIVVDAEQGEIPCRVIYNKALPPMNFNDELKAPPQYEQLIKYGIALKVCTKYGLPADKAGAIQAEYDSILTAIKKSNSFKHTITRPKRAHDILEDHALAVLTGRHL